MSALVLGVADASTRHFQNIIALRIAQAAADPAVLGKGIADARESVAPWLEAFLERARPIAADAARKAQEVGEAGAAKARDAAFVAADVVRQHPKTAAALACAVVAPPLAVAVVTAAGFTAGGVAAGSLAASTQSAVYAGATTGVFSALQSVGATGALSMASTAAVSTTGAALGVGVGAAVEHNMA